jgi:GT2 family glycosyltransferase
MSMVSREPFVSVIVVNYNGRHFLADCLGSLARQTYPRHRVEVILVDNASSDGSVVWVRGAHPWVTVVALARNAGFAEGNNVGFRLARGEWVALLNCDAAAEPYWLAESVRAGRAHELVGGVASQVLFRDRPGTINSTGLELYRDGRGGDRDFEALGHERNRAVGEVFGGCGAGLLLRKRMLNELGGFDPRLFMYYEDLDLAWRARRSGWRFIYTPAARVRHVFGGSAGVASPLQLHYVERNRARVNLANAPLLPAVGTALGLVARCVRTALRWLTRRSGTTVLHAAAHARAVAGFVRDIPTVLATRWRVRRTSPGSDRLFRAWARPAPRR